MNLAQSIWAALQAKKWLGGAPTILSQNPGEVNIVYLEGTNLDGSLNANLPNLWNDVRLVLGWSNGPFIVDKWLATTEPGKFYTENPLNPDGAARIAFGQYRAWKVGIHHAGKPNAHEALVQAGSIYVYRDKNKDFQRTGDLMQAGSNWGINQHNGYDLREVGKASAGCLVGQANAGHDEFMRIVKTDPRYIANNNYIFHTAIIPGADIQPFLAT